MDALEAYLRARAADGKERHEVTTYFDTPDRALERAGVSLRVGSADGTRVQTLKADRQDSVAADRAEWEWPVKPE